MAQLSGAPAAQARPAEPANNSDCACTVADRHVGQEQVGALRPVSGTERTEFEASLPSSTAGAVGTLHAGLSVRVTHADLDNVAPWTIRTAGNAVELVLNSSHVLFRRLDMPFCGSDSSPAFEVLLTAWALQEAVVPAQGKREMADVRFQLGQRVRDVLRGS